MVSILKYPYDGTYVKGEQAVHQIIKMRVETTLNDVFYDRQNGCRIDEALFEPSDNILEALASTYIRDAMLNITYIRITDITVDVDVEILAITVFWRFNDSIQRTTTLNLNRL